MLAEAMIKEMENNPEFKKQMIAAITFNEDNIFVKRAKKFCEIIREMEYKNHPLRGKIKG